MVWKGLCEVKGIFMRPGNTGRSKTRTEKLKEGDILS